MTIPGLTDDETKRELFDMVCALAKDKMVFCEVGTFVGGNVCYIGNRLKWLNKSVYIYAVDNWNCTEISEASRNHVGVQKDFYEAFNRNICAAGVNHMVEAIREDSLEAAKTFPDKFFDFIFLDSFHEYPFVLYELQAWLPKLKADSILGGHDYPAPGVKRAVLEVLGEEGINVTSNGASYWKILGKGL